MLVQNELHLGDSTIYSHSCDKDKKGTRKFFIVFIKIINKLINNPGEKNVGNLVVYSYNIFNCIFVSLCSWYEVGLVK